MAPLIERLKQLVRAAVRGPDSGGGRRRPRGRRRDPDYATLPGGDSMKEAAQAPPERARELAD
jgi:hypothetical protein